MFLRKLMMLFLVSLKLSQLIVLKNLCHFMEMIERTLLFIVEILTRGKLFPLC